MEFGAMGLWLWIIIAPVLALLLLSGGGNSRSQGYENR